jgi:hypothetical protein
MAHDLDTRKSLKNKVDPWCREGESNPQGPKPGGF